MFFFIFTALRYANALYTSFMWLFKSAHLPVFHIGAYSRQIRTATAVPLFYQRGASNARVIAIIACLSVLSVCLCVTRRYCSKTAKRILTQTTPRDSPGTLTFWRWWMTPFPEICAQSDPPPFKQDNFNQYLLIAPQTWELAKKVQLALIWSRPRAFQRAIDEPCTLPLTPPKGDTKRDFAFFSCKFQLLSKNVCYTISLCENCQQQYCSYIIPLSNGP